MAQQQVNDKYSLYTPQGAKRTVFNRFANAGIDLFASPAAQKPDSFLQLENVLPAESGGFDRRWGITNQSGVPSAYDAAFLTRLFSYQAPAVATIAGDYYSGYGDYYSILATEDTTIRPIYSEETLDAQVLTFPTSVDSQVFSATSRAFMYAFNGVSAPQKINWAKGDGQSPIGFPVPMVSGVSSLPGIGINYGSGTTTASLVDTSGSGSGAVISLVVSGGHLTATVSSQGTGYNVGTTSVVVTDSSMAGSGGDFGFVLSTAGALLVVYPNGPMRIVDQRVYFGAFTSTKSGHTSDISSVTTLLPVPTIQVLIDATTATYTGYIGGWSFNEITFQVVDPRTDYPLLDTFVLMATSDGGDSEHLYEVAQIPLSSFTSVGGGNIQYVYTDTLPDSYADMVYITGPTLLTNNLWVDVDVFGNIIGIFDNGIPGNTLNKPVLCQGRLYATDGKVLYYSKSLDEVTTSTGLITSKYEEAWPGSNQLDIAYDNEKITALLSDNTYLYIGTTKNIYRLTGENTQTFDLQCIFRNVGVQSQDLWTVCYKDGLPSAYMWLTPNSKVMLSDFNTYEDVGVPIYPILNSTDLLWMQCWVYGPYAMLFLRDTTGTFYVFNLAYRTWYSWNSSASTGPLLTYIKTTGASNLFFISGATVSLNNTLAYIAPGKTTDDYPTAATPINWLIQTGWLTLDDDITLKVVNQLECWSSEATLQTTINGISSSSSGANESTSVRNTIPGPFTFVGGSLRAYHAGAATAGKSYSFTFSPVSPGTGTSVLEQFIVDHYPFGRF